MKFFKKYKKISIAVLVLVVIIAGFSVWSYIGDKKALQREMDWGITYSAPYMERLGFDSREAYIKILDELGVDNLRLPVYWSRVESEQGDFYFDEVDTQVEEASKRGVDISLVVGRRVPRWPECWDPYWLSDLEKEKQDERILNLIENTVNHFKDREAIKYWQVENEPFLDSFGECPPSDEEFLKKEIDLVRSLDDRPIIITESGELSSWIAGSDLSDILGVSLYRVVWNETVGYFEWFLPPSFYRLKAYLAGRTPDEIFNTELQAEPWAPLGMVWRTPVKEQYKSMDLEQFRENVDFARRTGFQKTYLWGAEWWYFMKERRGVSDFWDEAKKLWQN